MMSLTFVLITHVGDSGLLGPLVLLSNRTEGVKGVGDM